MPRAALPLSLSDKMFWRRVFGHNPAFVAHCDRLQTKQIFVQPGEVFYALIYRADGRSGIFDPDEHRLRVTNTVVAKVPGRALPRGYPVPDCFGYAVAIARRLAADTEYLRVDFMVVDGKRHGGEITPYPRSG